MYNFKYFIYLLFISICLDLSAQNTIGTTLISEGVYDGFTLFSVHKKTYLINNCGQIINEWTSEYIPGHSVYILPNGDLLRAGRKDTSSINFGGVGGVIERFDWEGNLLWTFDYSTDNHRLHHDYYPLSNGNLLILVATRMSRAEAIQAGRNPSLLDSDLFNEQILEIRPAENRGGYIVWEWNAKDHLIQDFDATKDNFGNVANHPEKLDVNFIGHDNSANWLHVNSIQYNEDLDQIVISSRYMNEFWIIDHSTTTQEATSGSGGNYGKGGDFLYRWGNPQVYRQGTVNDQKLFGQHFPHFIPKGFDNEGKIILFNNGYKRTPANSEVLIIDPPQISEGVYQYTSGTSYGPTNHELLYGNNNSFYSSILSSAIVLPNKNILVAEGRFGHFFELNKEKEVVWDYVVPVKNSTGEVFNQYTAPNGNSTFRAIKYAKDFIGFTGRDLTPKDPIEGDFNLISCNRLSNENHTLEDVTLYPNPVNNYLTIQTKEIIDRVEVYNLLGKTILTNQSKNIDMSSLISGIYLIKITINSKNLVKKLIKN